MYCKNLTPLPNRNSYDSRCLSKISGFGIFAIIGIFQRDFKKDLKFLKLFQGSNNFLLLPNSYDIKNDHKY